MKKLLLLIACFPSFCMAQPLKLLLPIGHTDIITAAAISPNNKFILSAGGETVKVWDMASGKEMLSITAHREQVSSLFFLPDNSHFITTGVDSVIRIWSLKTGGLDKKIICKGGAINCSALSKDGNTLIVAAADKKIYITDLLNGNQTVFASGHKQNIGDIALSDDGNEILTAAYDDPIIWMSLKDGKILRNLITSTNPKYNNVITKVSFLPGQKQVLIGDRDMDASLWDLTTGKQIRSFKSVYNLPSSYSSMASILTGITAVNPIPNSNEVWLAREKTIARYDLKTGSLKKSIIAHDGDVETACVSQDGRFYITASNDLSLKLWESNSGRLLNTFKGHTEVVTGAILSPNKKNAVTYTAFGFIKFWDIQSGELLSNIQEHMGSVVNAQFNKKGDVLVSCGLDNKVKLTDIKNKTTLFTYSIGKPRVMQNWATEMKSVCFSPDEKEILVATDTSLQLVNLEKKQLRKAFRFPWNFGDFSIAMARYSHSGNEILFGEGYDINQLTISNGHKSKIFKSNDGFIKAFDITPDGNKLVVATDENKIFIKDLNDLQQPVIGISGEFQINSIQCSPDGKFVLTSSNDGFCHIWDITTGLEKIKLRGHDNWVNSASFSKDGNQIISSSDDQTVRYWDLQTGKLLASLVAVDESDYITVLADGSYRGSPRAISLMLFQYNNRVFPFEQFDLKWNRPDKVMSALQHPDTSLISLYRRAFDKRIMRLGVSDTNDSIDFDLPEISLPSQNSYPASTSASSILVNWTAISKKYPLQQLIVKVNGIPERKAIGTQNTQTGSEKMSDSIRLLLSEGINKIQFSCLNSKGIESLKETFYIQYNPSQKTKSKLWYIGIGMSKFEDSSHNLQFAAKDIRDLSLLFKQKDPSSEIDTFLNEKVTLKTLDQIKAILASTNIEDRVIISFSGHGLLDEQQSFYFAPYNQDFNTPSYKNSISYEMIENLLEQIPARKKLLLIDACNSGEIDKEPIETVAETKNNNGTVVIKEYKTRGAKIGIGNTQRTSMPNSFELMKSLFADLSNNNGAIVISAAAGNEFALENNKWNNGAFTFCIKKALLENLADKDKNGTTVSELKTYVSKQVEQLTNGRQKPTSRQENPDLDWKIWQ